MWIFKIRRKYGFVSSGGTSCYSRKFRLFGAWAFSPPSHQRFSHFSFRQVRGFSRQMATGTRHQSPQQPKQLRRRRQTGGPSVTNGLTTEIMSTLRIYCSSQIMRRNSRGVVGCKFKFCQSVHHYTIQINQPTRCNSFSNLLLDVYVRLNMFLASSRPSSGAQQLQQQPLVLPSERGDSSAVGRGRPEDEQQH